MAIAFRSTGTLTKVDTSVTGTAPSVAMPAGHVANDLLLMPVFTDDNTGSTTPSGWTSLFYISAGTSTNSPYAGWSHFELFYRIDTGSLGSSVNLNLSSASWPSGQPYVLSWITAYSGCDTTNPIGEWGTSTTQSSTAAQAHPSITTSLANCWLVTLRGIGSDNQRTFTDSVGTDSERVDDWAGFPASPSAAMYDSNAALSAGAQTVRTTTASGTVGYGSTMASVVLRPAPVAGAVSAPAQTAIGTGTAYSPDTVEANGPWDLCGAGGLPTYSFAIDWDSDGNYADLGDEVIGDIITDITVTYGRDQDRQLNPASVGNAAFSLCNVSRTYSPEMSTSPLYGNLEPARPMRSRVTWNGNTYPLFLGRIDDYTIKADMSDRSVDFTFLDGLNDLQEISLSTEVFQSMRTGALINEILDQANWTGGRDIDLGATVVPFWWVEGQDAFSAINDLVLSEGPPAIAFIAPDGTFTFHDRHHRIQNDASVTSQATFSQPALFDCTAPAVTGAFAYTAPFVYAHGWRDIVNSVEFEVSERQLDDGLTVVFSTEDNITLSSGQSYELTFSGNDPFMNAITPVAGTDYLTSGAGTLSVVLSRTSGASAKLTLMAVGGSLTIQSLQVRAHAISVSRTIKIVEQDTGSITTHGERRYPNSAPWANANDADAIANMILLRYAQRRPTVQMRVVTSDPQHFVQVLQRAIGDRIRIVNGELGLDDDFFVEQITHQIQRINQAGRPPVHSVVLGCEKDISPVTNPFTFDKRGAGFDDGVFDPIHADNPDTVFIFGDPVQGMFDTGLFGT